MVNRSWRRKNGHIKQECSPGGTFLRFAIIMWPRIGSCTKVYRRVGPGTVSHNPAMLIINADDWGRSREETDVALSCWQQGTLSSVTAMVFMKDSERAASLAKKANLNVGLHLNLIEPFTCTNAPSLVKKDQERVRRFLRRGKFALILYNPFLCQAFRRVYEAQATEFRRL